MMKGNNNIINTITFHRATASDAQLLADNRILFALELSGVQPEGDIEALRTQLATYFKQATRDNSCISYIAKCNDEIAGIGSVHIRDMPANFKNPSGKWGYIMNMYTLPEYRRKGVCRGILNALVECATGYGVTGFELHATIEGEMVYKQEGFIEHKEPTYRKFTTG
ncbi:MAG: GNAT family N-acetyltransferase [Bacteroidota bacterium]